MRETVAAQLKVAPVFLATADRYASLKVWFQVFWGISLTSHFVWPFCEMQVSLKVNRKWKLKSNT